MLSINLPDEEYEEFEVVLGQVIRYEATNGIEYEGKVLSVSQVLGTLYVERLGILVIHETISANDVLEV